MPVTAKELPRTIRMHPFDILAGVLVPQMQSYMVCGPPIPRDLSAVRPLVESLIRESFPRFCYRFPRRFRKLRLSKDVAQPLSVLTLDEIKQAGAGELRRLVGDRHWHLVLVKSPQASILVLLFDHFLCHGDTARRFLLAAFDLLVGAGPPQLTEGQRTLYEDFQRHMSGVFHAEAAWADYHRLSFEAGRIQNLAAALGRSFTDAIMLWLARSIHDVSGRSRRLRIQSFRMDPEEEPEEIPDAAFGNKNLIIQRWEMEPDGGFESLDPPRRERLRREAKAFSFYRKFPFKGLLNRLIKKTVEKEYKKSARQDLERLTINNMGSTAYPFFRTMFFNPVAKELDRFGLVFVDGHAGRATLQFCPSKRYLEGFSWDAFARRLEENLDGMITDPRVREPGAS
jgi:hypothetical protein